MCKVFCGAKFTNVFYALQSQELGSLLLAIANLAEQCHMQHYGPLQEMEWLSKLDMIQVSNKHCCSINRKAAQDSGVPAAKGIQIV